MNKHVFLLAAFALLLAACAPAETAEIDPSIVTDTEAPETAPAESAAEASSESSAESSSEPEMVGDVVGELENEPEATEPAAAATGGITREELAQHSTARDCWVGYEGVVYDLTSWLAVHPGGAAAIAPYCGTVEEFTEAYKAQHNRRDSTRISNRGDEQGTLAE